MPVRQKVSSERQPVPILLISGEGFSVVPERRIVMAGTMDLGDKRILISLVTFEFLQTDTGTDLILTDQGTYLDGVSGLTPQMLEAGWRKLLDHLQTELMR